MNDAQSQDNQSQPEDTYPEPGYWIYRNPTLFSAEQDSTPVDLARIIFRPQLDSVEGHDCPVAAVAFLPNGDQAVSLDINKGLIIWDAKQGVPIQRYQLDEHLGSITSVQVSPDGRLLIVDIYSSSNNIKCAAWDLQSQTMRYTIPGNGGFGASGIIAPGPQPALLYPEGSVLNVWDLESGNLRHTLQGHTRSIGAVTPVPNSPLVLIASGDSTIKLWDISTGQERASYHHHTSPVSDVVISAYGRLAASRSSDRKLILWDIGTGQTVHVFENIYDYSLCMQTQGNMLISCNEDRFTVWDLARKARCMTVEVFSEDILGQVEILPDSHLAFFIMDDWLTSYQYMFHVLDMERGEVIASFRASNSIYQCAVSPSGKMIALGDNDGKVHFVDFLEPKIMK